MKTTNILIFSVCTVVLGLLLIKEVNAQVVINEVFPNPIGTESGAEWVELFNISDNVVSLKNCNLFLHATLNNQKVEFGEEAFIDKYEVISWDDSWLNNSGDQVLLSCPDFNDKITYGDVAESSVAEPKEGISIGRSPNGSGDFYILATVTMGEVNSLPPTPTLEPTHTSTPTPRPTSTPSPSPTPKPSATKTPSPTLKPQINPTIDITKTQNSNDTLGIQETNQEASPSPYPVKESSADIPFPAIGLIVVGVGLVIASFYPYLKKLKKAYNFRK